MSTVDPYSARSRRRTRVETVDLEDVKLGSKEENKKKSMLKGIDQASNANKERHILNQVGNSIVFRDEIQF